MKMYSRIIGCMLLVLTGMMPSTAQQKAIDSLSGLLRSSNSNQEKGRLHIKIAREYISFDTAKAKDHLQAGLQLANNSQDAMGIGMYHLYASYLLCNKGLYNDGLVEFKNASDYLTRFLSNPKITKAEKGEAESYLLDADLSQGNVYLELYEYEKAVDIFWKVLKLLEQSDFPEKSAATASTYQSIALAYYHRAQYQTALQYYLQAVPHAQKSGNERVAAESNIYAAMCYTLVRKYDSSAVLLQQAEPVVLQSADAVLKTSFYARKAELYRFTEKWQEAADSYGNAIQNARVTANTYMQATFSHARARCLLKLNRIQEARDAGLQALQLSMSIDKKREILESQKVLSMVEAAAGNYQKAYGYLEQFQRGNDSLHTEEITEKLQALDKKYQSALQQEKISQLEKDKQIQAFATRRKENMNYVLGSGLLISLVIGGLGYRNYQQRQTLQRQRILELEKEKQLNAAEAVLKGEEQERRRLAKDLHDGLGGMLSGIKFSLQHMQRELPNDAQPAIHRSLDMLDSSISEMRRVAHNMMPEVLMRFGLDKALQDYCHSITEHGQLQLVYQSSGLDQMEKGTTIDITVYRIVQELVNNIVKHAHAQNALVQATFLENKLTVTVEDDGIGFEPDKAYENGIGWTNILSRVAFLNGQIDVKSGAGEGTSVLVELPANAGTHA